MSHPAGPVHCASVLDPNAPTDAERWSALRDDPRVDVVDTIVAHRA